MVVIHHWGCTRESQEGWETPGVTRERERSSRIAWQSWEPRSLFLQSPLCCLPFFEPLCVKLMAAKWPAAMVHLCWKWRKQCEANALMIWLINCLLYLIDHKAAEQRFTSSDAGTTKPQLVVREIVSGLMLTFKHCGVFHFSQKWQENTVILHRYLLPLQQIMKIKDKCISKHYLHLLQRCYYYFQRTWSPLQRPWGSYSCVWPPEGPLPALAESIHVLLSTDLILLKRMINAPKY